MTSVLFSSSLLLYVKNTSSISMVPLTFSIGMASGASSTFGSDRIMSVKRTRPAQPFMNVSMKLASLRIGVMNVAMYR